MGTNLHVKVGINPSATLQDGTYRRGMIVSGGPASDPQGTKIVPPRWIQVVITDREPGQIEYLWSTEWETVFVFDIVGHNAPQDGYRVDVSVDPIWVSTSGLNSLTRSRIEQWLNRWGATVVNFGTNNVRFDVRILDALTSEGFWEIDLTEFDFIENSYNSGTGIHNITVTYPVGVQKEKVISYIINELGYEAFISLDEPSRQIVFEAGSAPVYEKFKEILQLKAAKRFRNRVWVVNEAGITAALAAGGYIEVTAVQAQNYLHNLLDD